MEVFPQHANDCVGLVPHRQRCADDLGISPEPSLPEAVAQHYNLSTVGRILLRRECAPQHHGRAKDAEVALCDMNAMDQLRPIAGDVETGPGKVICGNIFEDAGLLLIDLELRYGCDRSVALRVGQFNLDDPVGVGIGQRFEQHGVHNSKNRRVSADAQRQCRDSGKREAGALDEEVNRMFHVVPEIAHWCSPIAEFFACVGRSNRFSLV